MLKPAFLNIGLMAALAFSLSACFAEEAEKEDKEDVKTEQVSEENDKEDDDDEKGESGSTYHTGSDMTPAEALENMKQDAGKVADTATDLFNKAKDEATKALSD